MKKIWNLIIIMCMAIGANAQGKWEKVDGLWKYTEAGKGSFVMWDVSDSAFRIYSDNGDFMVEDDNMGFVEYKGQKVRVELYDSTGVKKKSYKLWLDVADNEKNCLKTRVNPGKVISVRRVKKINRIFNTLKHHGSVSIIARRPGKPLFDMVIKSRED